MPQKFGQQDQRCNESFEQFNVKSSEEESKHNRSQGVEWQINLPQ